MKNRIIDCHTHLQTKELINEYFELNEQGYAISIRALDSLIGNGLKFFDEIKDENRIFVCDCIDAEIDISRQLLEIEARLKEYNIVGIKIYTGYQSVFANDKKFYPIYDFAKKYGLSIVYHCGIGAESLKNYELNYASSVHVGKVAKEYPSVNFICSHFDYPNFEDCAKVVAENKNVYTDISGAYEGSSLDMKTIDIFVDQLSKVIAKYPTVIDKTMFGTDYFGKDTDFGFFDEYIITVQKLFKKFNQSAILFDNCIKAYPKLFNLILKTKK